MKARSGNANNSLSKPEASYAYYQRCERSKQNGEQCKAPALKGTRVCYKHAQVDEAAARRQREAQALGLHDLSDPRAIQAALWKVSQALIDGRIEENTARTLLRDVRKAVILVRSSQKRTNLRQDSGQVREEGWKCFRIPTV